MTDQSVDVDVMAGLDDTAPVTATTDENDGAVESPEDAKLFCKFTTKMRPDKTYEGTGARPSVEVEYYEIRIPGSKDARSGPVTEAIKQRFPRHYKAFKNRVAAPVSGSPLADWAGITRAEAEMLSYNNVKTVEQLANLADGNMTDIRGGVRLKQKAQAWLKDREGLKGSEDLARELEKRDATISTLTERLNDMEKRLTAKDAKDTDDLSSDLDADSEPVAKPKSKRRKVVVKKEG